MNRTAFIVIGMLLFGAGPGRAGTFVPTPYLPNENVDVLTRQVANEQFSRDLMGTPYATVVLGRIDVYDRFPYLESRYFQFVSDPAWNRVLMGEVGRGVAAYDGNGGQFGALRGPRGLATDGRARVFIADAGNHRVLAFRAVTEFDRIELEPLFSIDGLARPYGVAYSDGGTPFDSADDRLYVANTGRNEVRAYALDDRSARFAHAVGELGSGPGRFAGPMAITTGRRDGAHTGDVYVADAHNRRIVRLSDSGDAWAWTGEVAGPGPVTSLDTDAWGNVYAASPQTGSVLKFSPALETLASHTAGIERPRGFHVVFHEVVDHRDGTRRLGARGAGVMVEEWNGRHGIRMLNLGVDIARASAAPSRHGSVQLRITDRAAVSAELVDISSGSVVARRDAGVMNAGDHSIAFEPGDFVAEWNAGDYRVRVRARSTYEHGDEATVDVPVRLSAGGAPPLPKRLTLLGNTPNPFNPATTIRFVVPAGPRRDYSLRIYDVAGRLVRVLASGQIDPGRQEVRWDGTDDRGAGVSSGVYLYRIAAGAEALGGKMVLLK